MKEVLNKMLNHEELSRTETRDIIVGITKDEFPTEQITALLTGLQMRGVTVDELFGCSQRTKVSYLVVSVFD